MKPTASAATSTGQKPGTKAQQRRPNPGSRRALARERGNKQESGRKRAMREFRLPLALSAILIALFASASPAQTSSSAPPVSSQTLQETQQNQDKKGKVILQRSIDENGNTVDGPASPTTPPVQQPIQPPKIAAQPTAEDTERSALAYTEFDLDVRLRPAESHIAVRALVTVRNDGKTPLTHIPLQLSSDLNWEQIRLNGRQTPFTAAVLNSVADHTGQLHEAAITLPTPLAPGA